MKNTSVAQAYQKFTEVLSLAERELQKSRLEAAAALAELAAQYAFPGRAGVLCSPRLERLLISIGQRIPQAYSPGQIRPAGLRRRVLHVLTHARPIGGDTRFAWRWILRDPSSCHSVAITQQSAVDHLFEIPESMRNAVAASGGEIHVLRNIRGKVLECARELRALCVEVDVVVLHLFPYDIVPLLALSPGTRPVKVLFVHHSDHTFWLGAGVSHLILHLRHQPPNVVDRLRRLNPARTAFLPIPLELPTSLPAKVAARTELGIAPDAVVLLTIATPFKYRAPNQPGFLDLVCPVLQANPQVVLLAVGPEPTGEWKEAADRLEGRVRAFGARWDTNSFYAAADIYLDSLPFASITSLLEAGMRELPLLSLNRFDTDLALLGPGAPGLTDVIELAVDAREYGDKLTHLIRNPIARERLGVATREKISRLHAGSEWAALLDEAYAKAGRLATPGCFNADDDISAEGSLIETLDQLYRRPASFSNRLIRAYIGQLQYLDRLRIGWHLWRQGFGLSVFTLVPPPFDRLTRWIVQTAKSSFKSNKRK